FIDACEPDGDPPAGKITVAETGKTAEMVKKAESGKETEPGRSLLLTPLCKPYLFDQCRDEQESHEQGYHKVDHYHCREILQVEAYPFIQQEDHGKCADGGDRGGQDRHKSIPVPLVHDMVGHDDGIVDDQAQRDGDAGQGEQLYLQFEQVIEDGGDGQVNEKAGGDQEKVTPVACDQQYEKGK